MNVESAMELPAFKRQHDRQHLVDPDLVIRRERFERTEPGETVAVDRTPGRELAVQRLGDGSLLVEAVGLRMLVDPAASILLVDEDVSAETAQVVGWLVGGLGLAVVMLQRGKLVVHGSLVAVGRKGHLLMAPSGHGKSITAAAVCAAGGSLVAEDTVRVALPTDRTGSASAPAGSSVIRLRRTIVEMSHFFSVDRLSTSSDQRVLVNLPAGPATSVIDTLDFVVLDPAAAVPSVIALDPASATVACMRHLRVPGLVPGPDINRAFDSVGALVASTVPRILRLPWTGSMYRFFDDVAELLAESS